MSEPAPLSKTERRAAERREREAEKLKGVFLEPGFPFVIIPFDPGFFSMTASPPDKLTQPER